MPERGATTEASVFFIKRIIGLPGETIQARGGHVQICHAERPATTSASPI